MIMFQFVDNITMRQDIREGWRYVTLFQGSHRLEKDLNIQECLESP